MICTKNVYVHKHRSMQLNSKIGLITTQFSSIYINLDLSLTWLIIYMHVAAVIHSRAWIAQLKKYIFLFGLGLPVI